MNYADDFNYIGAHVDEREKLIKDDDSTMGVKCEQSDSVILLLNLSAIPDWVVQRMTFKPGFSQEFLRLFKEYRKIYEKKHGVQWEYQNEALIQRYLTFKRARSKLRQNLYDKGGGSSSRRDGGDQIEMVNGSIYDKRVDSPRNRS